jgi:hypothetical protein
MKGLAFAQNFEVLTPESKFVRTKFPIISAFGRKNRNLIGKPPTAGHLD